MAGGGDLASKHAKQRGAIFVEFETIIAGHRAYRIGSVIDERPNASIIADYRAGADRGAEIAICGFDQIVDFFL